MKKGEKNRGFTLIELIVVVAIMAVLLSVLGSVYTRYLEKTRRSMVLQELSAVLDVFRAETSFAASDGSFWGKVGVNEWTDRLTKEHVGILNNYSFWRYQQNADQATLKDTVSNDMAGWIVDELKGITFWKCDSLGAYTFEEFYNAVDDKDLAALVIEYDEFGNVLEIDYSRKGYFVRWKDGEYETWGIDDKDLSRATFELADWNPW